MCDCLNNALTLAGAGVFSALQLLLLNDVVLIVWKYKMKYKMKKKGIHSRVREKEDHLTIW